MTEQTNPVQWYAKNTSSDQGLVIDELTGQSIAVTYNAEHAPFIVTACNSHAALVDALEKILTAPDYMIGKIAREALRMVQG